MFLVSNAMNHFIQTATTLGSIDYCWEYHVGCGIYSNCIPIEVPVVFTSKGTGPTQGNDGYRFIVYEFVYVQCVKL